MKSTKALLIFALSMPGLCTSIFEKHAKSVGACPHKVEVCLFSCRFSKSDSGEWEWAEERISVEPTYSV
jgi:hypothetical protein